MKDTNIKNMPIFIKYPKNTVRFGGQHDRISVSVRT